MGKVWNIRLNDLLFVVLAMLLMSIPAAFEPGHFAKALLIGAVGFSLSVSLLLLWLTNRLGILRKIVWVLLFALFSVECYVYVFFGSRFDPNILTLMLQTNRAEASEFFRVYMASPTSLCFVGLAAACGLLPLFFTTKATVPLRHPWLVKTLVAGVFVLGLALPFLPLPFPMGRNTLVQAVNNFQFVVEQHGEIDTMEAMLDSIHVSRTPSTDEAPAIVLVIGESHNKNHSAIYGYPLPTSPHAEQEQKSGNLVVFQHAMSPTNGTSWAMRFIFSLKGCDSEPTDPAQCVLMPAVFRKAGYRVTYLDNQYTRSTGGSLDYSCGYFLSPSAINQACFDERNQTLHQYDDDFVRAYRYKMDTSPKSLVILHLKGQHFDAALRYPQRSSVFSSADIQRTDLTDGQKVQVADYDNATRYNDLVLSHIIDVYRRRAAVVVYLSDHGEQIYDGPDRNYGRGFDNPTDKETLQNVYEVPLMVWCSDTYQQRHPDKFGRIRASASRHVCTADLAYFLFDLADIDCNFHKPRRSFIHPRFAPHKVNIGSY